MKGNTKEGRVFALLPILVFLLVFLGSGLITRNFYGMLTIAAFLIALLVAFVQNKELSFSEKTRLATEGAGNESIITMYLIFLAAGAFTGTVKAVEDVSGIVNLGLSTPPSNVAVASLFLIGCFISISMGTSVGTITTLTPIAVGISKETGFSMAVCTGAMVGGTMFGDSLSMISGTTIATVKAQGCKMRGEFEEDFLVVLPTAIVTIILFLVLGRDAAFGLAGNLSYNLFRVLPYMVVLAGALAEVNVFVVPITGTVLSLITDVATGTSPLGEVFNYVGAGITGMYDVAVISVVVACIVTLVREYSGIDFILAFIRKRINGERGDELDVAALTLLVNMCTASNTVAIVISGPTAGEISDDFGMTPRRSASFLNMFSSIGRGLIPYEAQLLAAATITGLTPFEIIPYYSYPILMGVNGLALIFIKKRTRG